MARSSRVKLFSTTEQEVQVEQNLSNSLPNIVLVAGFESFNRDLYVKAAKDLPINLQVFADSDIRLKLAINGEDAGVNPEFSNAVENADAFIGSLIFDYDDALAVKDLLSSVKGPRLIFECATELMTFNQVGSFSMDTGDQPAGPPPAVKAVLSKFSSGKEEDKLAGYLKLLKVGPDLLKFVPGEKANDLRTWLEAYRFWNQGGRSNVGAMLQLVAGKVAELDNQAPINTEIPQLQVTPDVGLLHPLKQGRDPYFTTPSSYLNWRLSASVRTLAEKSGFQLAPASAPRVAVLLYR